MVAIATIATHDPQPAQTASCGAKKGGPDPVGPARPSTACYQDQERLTLAPASSSFALAASAASFGAFSRIGFGAASTRSLLPSGEAETSSRTTLMTWIFFSPAASRTS